MPRGKFNRICKMSSDTCVATSKDQMKKEMPETDMIDSGESQVDSRLNSDLNINEEVSENDESLHVDHGLNTNYDSSDGAIPVHRCDRCEYETISKSSWLTHIASCQASGDEKRKLFECDVCNMKFSNGANMRRHKMRHTGFKPYECRVCQKRFFRKDHLAEHFTTHTKTLPYHCPICNRGFQRQIAMRAHFQNEHVGQNDIVKSCPLCSYRANSMKSLRVHFYNRHGIDLDRPVGGESNGNGAGGSDSGDSVRSGDNATPPMHFLTPQVEISLPEPPSPSRQMEVVSKAEQTERIGGGDESPASSPHSGDSNVPTSSRLDPENGPLTPSVSLIPIKQEMETDEVHRIQPVNLTTRSTGTAATLTSLIKVSPLTSLLREDFRPSSTETPDSAWRSKQLSCGFCGIGFPDQTLYFLHKGCHSDSNPWKCNICGEQCSNVYDFNSHLLSKTHQ